MYSIIFSETAQKQFEKLERTLQERIMAVLDRCKIKPYTHITKVVGTEYFRARAGDYRIFIKIENNKLLIMVLKICKRENAYDRI
jgi:mRNA-degrading endonuclease RelE of RelBE toxin-antitoxin system